MEDKKLGFNLFLDEEMTSGLQFITSVFQTLEMNKGSGLTESPLYNKYKIGVDRFFDVLGDKVHEMGWCKDENCEFKNKKYEKR